MDYKKNTPTGYLYGNPPSRITELIVFNLLRGNLAWWVLIYETSYPTLPADNATDRSGMHYCSKCGWQPLEKFGRDKTLSEKRNKHILRRYCKTCDAKRKAAEKARRETVWRRAG